MGSGKAYDLHEVIRDDSSQKMKRHRQMLQDLLDRGYEIESQEKEEDKTGGNQVIAVRLVTVLKPVKNFNLPLLKFEAGEAFGKYFDDNDVFYPHETPQFVLKAFKKSSEARHFNDRWMPFDVDLR